MTDGSGYGKSEPPTGNYGGGTYTKEAEVTQQGALPAVLIDWLNVRLDHTSTVFSGLERWLGPMVDREHGWRGFYDRSALVLEKGIVAWCSDRERAKVQGVVVSLSGQALALLGDKVLPFIAWAVHRGRVTRIDFAIDDHSGVVSLDKVQRAWEDGRIVTRWQETTLFQRRIKGVLSATFYAGTRKGETMLRIYNKGAQMRSAGPWTRVELETHKKTADALARAYMKEGSAAVVGQINRRIRFVVPDGQDTNIRRWPVASWWADFLVSLEPGPSLAHGTATEMSIDLMQHWLERQVSGTMAALVLADGGSISRILGAIQMGASRIKPKHLAAIDAYQALGVPP